MAANGPTTTPILHMALRRAAETSTTGRYRSVRWIPTANTRENHLVQQRLIFHGYEHGPALAASAQITDDTDSSPMLTQTGRKDSRIFLCRTPSSSAPPGWRPAIYTVLQGASNRSGQTWFRLFSLAAVKRVTPFPGQSPADDPVGVPTPCSPEALYGLSRGGTSP